MNNYHLKLGPYCAAKTRRARAPRARAVRVKTRVVKFLRTAQMTMRTAQCILQELYGNRNFTAKELYSPEIFDTSSFYHKRRRFALRGYGREKQ